MQKWMKAATADLTDEQLDVFADLHRAASEGTSAQLRALLAELDTVTDLPQATTDALRKLIGQGLSDHAYLAQ